MPKQHGWAESLATRLITNNGRYVNLVSVTSSGTDYDPDLSEISDSVKAVQVGFTKQDQEEWLIEEHDKVFLVDSAIEPTPGMRLNDGKNYEIKAVREVKPGATVCLYRVQARI